MTTCNRCHQEITKDDERKANFREDSHYETVDGKTVCIQEYTHRRCPTASLICHICGQPVADSKNAGTAAWPRHSDCRLSSGADAQVNPSSWIVRR